ncbi:MAG: hypothetical protein LBH11_04725, partial [Propionibacteriaceae bacterium]|nr:hypothetical protein [Propionibacteriaceae bacterium]
SYLPRIAPVKSSNPTLDIHSPRFRRTDATAKPRHLNGVTGEPNRIDAAAAAYAINDCDPLLSAQS